MFKTQSFKIENDDFTISENFIALSYYDGKQRETTARIPIQALSSIEIVFGKVSESLNRYAMLNINTVDGKFRTFIFETDENIALAVQVFNAVDERLKYSTNNG